MVFKEKEISLIDQAWNQLHERLENDGLLQEKQGSGRKSPIPASFKWLAAAVISVACLFGGWHLIHKAMLPDSEMQVLHNEANAPILATMLEDGSIVYLSELASLKYPDHFAEEKREVTLRGEAFFNISNQSGRPFLINTELAQIEVVGTSFSVKTDQHNSFLLSVREGEVRVSRKNRQQILSVKAGESVWFDSEQLQVMKHSDTFDKYFSHIQFKDESLKNVADILNVHSESMRLEVDPEVAQRTITFALSKKGDIAQIAEIICLALNLQHIQQDNTVYISKKQ